MIQVRIGSTEWRACPSGVPDSGFVLFTGEFLYAADGLTPHMVWDAGLGNIRAMTQAEIDALPGLQATQRAQSAKAQAQAAIDRWNALDSDLRERIEFALVDTIRDEFNRYSALVAAQSAAVAAATSLADLKTRWAAITLVPQRSLADLANVIRTKIGATPEHS
jgi:hypothetical protein